MAHPSPEGFVIETTLAGTPGGIGLMARLKRETAALHAHAESRPFHRALMSGTASPRRYSSYLAELLHVHAQLESMLRRHRSAHAEIGRVFHDRHEREGDLRADLSHFGRATETDPEPATRALVAAIGAAAQTQPVALLGALYVLEGSMNGNAYLARSLGRSWSMEPGPGLRYLSPYGEAQREVWAAFRAEMDACTFTSAEADAIVAMAQRTFEGVASISEAVPDEDALVCGGATEAPARPTA